MKKLLLKIAAAITTAALSVGMLAGCGLFAVDTDRDMSQVVATVRISEKIEPTDIYKKDLAAGYVSYGYRYVQSYSYTTSAAYELVLDNLINNAVIIQQSKIQLAENSKEGSALNMEYAEALPKDNAAALKDLYDDGYLYLFASDREVAAFEKANSKLKRGGADYISALNEYVYNTYKDKNGLDINDAAFRFVDEASLYLAISSAVDNVNGLIDSFVTDEEEEEEYENITYSPRTTPTITKDNEKSDEEKIEEYKANAIDFTGDRSSLFAKAFARLKGLGLIAETEDYELRNQKSVLSLSYFTDLVNSSVESSLVSVYEDALKNASNIDYTRVEEIYGDNSAKADSAKAEILSNVWKQYEALRNAQKTEFSSDLNAYETKLAAVSDSSFVAYNAKDGYFYVSHMLVGYGDELTKVVSDITSTPGITNAEVEEKVNELAAEIVAEDLRASWVESGYGTYNGNDKTFKFSDSYVYNTDGPLATFLGKIGEVTTYTTKNDDGDDVHNFRFSGVTPNKYDYDEFRGLVSEVLFGNNGQNIELNEVYDLYDDNAPLRIEKDKFDNFEDLKFAFSTDTGNFNNYLGYVYSPVTSEGKYVSAFNEACKKVGGKVGSLCMFMSKEFGLHVVLCTAKANYGEYESIDAFKADLDRACGEDADKNTVAYYFMKANVDLVTDNYIGDIAQSFIYKYTKDGAKTLDKDGNETKNLIVTRYEKAYNDLITE